MRGIKYVFEGVTQANMRIVSERWKNQFRELKSASLTADFLSFYNSQENYLESSTLRFSC